MSGEEFFRAMRQDRSIGKIPIILITGTAGRGTAWLAGAAAYLPKPFSESDLNTAIERVLEPPQRPLTVMPSNSAPWRGERSGCRRARATKWLAVSA